MNRQNSTKSFGYLLKRTDALNISVMKFKQELLYNLFEAQIIKNAILSFQDQSLSKFDSTVGDWKCQTRTSMIIDAIFDAQTTYNQLTHDLIQIEALLIKNEDLFNKINNYTSIECQRLTKYLHQTSLSTALQEYNILYTPSLITELLSLSFLTTPKNVILTFFNQYHISTHKQKAIINNAKQQLCHLSIEYAQQLIKKYGTSEERLALQQIEIKNIQHMTSLFVEFRSIFKKMKHEQQPFIIRQTYFCKCGKIQSIENSFYAVTNNQYKKTAMPFNHDHAITTIEAYQYPGSLEQLQNLLSVSHHEVDIPKQYYQPCQCVRPTPKKSITSIDEAIMAFFAQHPQFTNHAPIDFARFGLLDSDLKKEYDYLLTLPGFSRHDMSIFQIIHMYPSTIADVVAETNQLNETLKQQIIKPIKSASIKVTPQIH